MSNAPQASLLPDGRRLHLHHGPIDLILGVDGGDREACFAQAKQRFETVLTGLVAHLPALRQPVDNAEFSDAVAQRMQAAVFAHRGCFVTPMAAVAGAVADDVLAAMIAGQDVARAYVNNGGDIAFHLAPGARFAALGPAGEITFEASDAARGIATSGWRGRSYSLGIADAVSVAARSAAEADVAATLIANAVDLPGHHGITRAPANEVSPDSDLGARLVTVAVAGLSPRDVERALQRGLEQAAQMRDAGLILDAVLSLSGQCRALSPEQNGALSYA
ncbi:MAG: UPF0280 family protein [Aliishimia sp.]